MTTYWLDYSAAQLSAQTILNAGYKGVIRYIDTPANFGGKHTTPAEWNDDKAKGLGVEFVFEVGVNDSAGGFNAGVAYAKRAKAGADYLGYTGVIYAANDQTTVNITAWKAYLDGFASVLGLDRTGAYGFANAISAAQGHASKFWQAGARSTLLPFSHVWQDNNWKGTVGGISVDRNEILKEDVTDVALGGDDFKYLFFDNALSTIDGKEYNAGYIIENTYLEGKSTHADVENLIATVAQLQATVAALQTGGVDVAALSNLVAKAVVDQIAQPVAKAVADENARRMES